MASLAVRAPWYHWLVAIIGIVWNGFGAMDYAMTQTRGDEWLRQMNMSDAMIAYMNAMPWWAMAVWALGTWGGLIGALLLLFRSKLAVPAFAISLVAFLISLVYSYLLSNGVEVMGGPSTYVMNAVILTGCIFFLWYARHATARGILR